MRQTHTAALLFYHTFHKPLQLSILQLQQPSIEMDSVTIENAWCTILAQFVLWGVISCKLNQKMLWFRQIARRTGRNVCPKTQHRAEPCQHSPNPSHLTHFPSTLTMLWIWLPLPFSPTLFVLSASCNNYKCFMLSSYANCLNIILGVSWYQEFGEVNDMKV